MKKIKLDLENCYGIKKMKEDLDFSKHNVIAIYAPNSSMKSSLTQTFIDLSNDEPSKDRFFSERVTKRKITDENNIDIEKEIVLPIKPYTETYDNSEKTLTLLVNEKLRKEYENLYKLINEEKELFIKNIKKVSGSKKDIEKEISLTFTNKENDFRNALFKIKEDMERRVEAPFSNIKYDSIFNDKVLEFLSLKDIKKAIQNYINKYNELIEKSTYFKKYFNYYNAEAIAKQLTTHGFFKAKHSVVLNAKEPTIIKNRRDLEKVIEDEKNEILQNEDLIKRFNLIEDQISRNKDLRDFNNYLSDNENILPHLGDLELFKKEIWKSYFSTRIESYYSLLENYKKVEKRRAQIEGQASKESTLWEKAIKKFNERFYVPFKLEVKNKTRIMLGLDHSILLGFKFIDGKKSVEVERTKLMQGLSQGEKKAFYILNLIFEIENRKKTNSETIFIIDDIADSFDYKNKYAIIQYLKEISEIKNFYQIILTHNFDFFRTIESRFLHYGQCFFAYKSGDEIRLDKALGIRNIFVRDWKLNFFKDSKKRIASIPFIRNIVEYTTNEKNPIYLKLTSLLHYKKETESITEKDLSDIFNDVFKTTGKSKNGEKRIIELLDEEAESCCNEIEGINFEDKIILSIAIRLKAEKFMIDKINDDDLISRIKEKQTIELFKFYKNKFGENDKNINTIEKVILMTPENIHLNSFMYEPILDMSDRHLKDLYRDICKLN